MPHLCLVVHPIIVPPLLISLPGGLLVLKHHNDGIILNYYSVVSPGL